MSIRRVSDLPQLNREEADISGFQNSFMEISYLSALSDEYERYESRKIKTKDILSVFQEIVLSGPNIHGNVYINTDLDAIDPDKYEIDIRAANISILSRTPTYIRSLSTDYLSSQYLKIINDYGSNPNEYDGVNYKLLTSYVAEQLRNFKGGVQFPLLSFIFSDHIIESDEWKIAGSTINFSEEGYLALKNEVLDDSGNLKQKYRSDSQSARDSWVYQYMDGILTLPTAKDFFRAVDQTQEGGLFVSCHAPNITGSIMSKTRAQNETEPFTFSDKLTSKGSLKASKVESANTYGVKASSLAEGGASRGISFDASWSSQVYQSGVTDIVPDHVQVYVYFYVGPKNT